MPPRGTNAYPFEGPYLGLGGEIQKSSRWHHLYCHKLQTATQHSLIASLVRAVGGGCYAFYSLLILYFVVVCKNLQSNDDSQSQSEKEFANEFLDEEKKEEKGMEEK